MTLGELFLLRISPWSKRIRDVLRHSKATVTVREYHPYFTGWMLKLGGRIGRESKVTAPIFFPQDGSPVIMDGYLIAKILDNGRAPGVESLFPEEHSQQIETLVNAAEVSAFFGRGYIFDEMIARPELAVGILVPPLLKYMPFRDSVTKYILGQFRNKYMPQTIEGRKTGAIESALDTISKALEDNNTDNTGNEKFLVGSRITYADIAVAYALPFVYSTSSVWKCVGNHAIGERYPALKSWGDKYWAKIDALKS